VDKNSISARTDALRREIEVIQRAEDHYHYRKIHSYRDKMGHSQRELQLLAIRKELAGLRKTAKRLPKHR